MNKLTSLKVVLHLRGQNQRCLKDYIESYEEKSQAGWCQKSWARKNLKIVWGDFKVKLSKEKKIGMVFIVISIILAVLGYIMLPETVVVQIGLDGKAGNTLPKLAAILLPLGVTLISTGLYMFSETSNRTKNLVFAGIGVLMAVFGIIVN